MTGPISVLAVDGARPSWSQSASAAVAQAVPCREGSLILNRKIPRSSAALQAYLIPVEYAAHALPITVNASRAGGLDLTSRAMLLAPMICEDFTMKISMQTIAAFLGASLLSASVLFAQSGGGGGGAGGASGAGAAGAGAATGGAGGVAGGAAASGSAGVAGGAAGAGTNPFPSVGGFGGGASGAGSSVNPFPAVGGFGNTARGAVGSQGVRQNTPGFGNQGFNNQSNRGTANGQFDNQGLGGNPGFRNQGLRGNQGFGDQGFDSRTFNPGFEQGAVGSQGRQSFGDGGFNQPGFGQQDQQQFDREAFDRLDRQSPDRPNAEEQNSNQQSSDQSGFDQTGFDQDAGQASSDDSFDRDFGADDRMDSDRFGDSATDPNSSFAEQNSFDDGSDGFERDQFDSSTSRFDPNNSADDRDNTFSRNPSFNSGTGSTQSSSDATGRTGFSGSTPGSTGFSGTAPGSTGTGSTPGSTGFGSSGASFDERDSFNESGAFDQNTSTRSQTNDGDGFRQDNFGVQRGSAQSFGRQQSGAAGINNSGGFNDSGFATGREFGQDTASRARSIGATRANAAARQFNNGQEVGQNSQQFNRFNVPPAAPNSRDATSRAGSANQRFSPGGPGVSSQRSGFGFLDSFSGGQLGSSINQPSPGAFSARQGVSGAARSTSPNGSTGAGTTGDGSPD